MIHSVKSAFIPWRGDRLTYGLALGTLALGGPAPAVAQYYDGSAYAFPVTDMIGPAIAGASMNTHLDRSRTGRRDTHPQGNRPAPAGRPAADLRFSATPAISQGIKARFRARLIRDNPGKRAEIDRALARDWLAGYRTDIATPNGLDPRNLADAVTAYFVASWAIVHKVDQISPRAVASVRDHFRTAMAASPQTNRMRASARQEMGEELIYQTVLIMANRTQIARTRDARLADAASRHYRSAVQTGAHVDLQALRLEDRGFVAR